MKQEKSYTDERHILLKVMKFWPGGGDAEQ